MITIGQIAALAGVTVRTVRHYHHLGLLLEPGRDASGYRRYGAEHVVRLLEVAALADAGVPLARIDELLAAGPEQLARAVADIDRRLEARIDELQASRRRLAGLTAGDRLVVPPQVADYLDALRAMGVSEDYIRMERDGWMILRAIVPDHVPRWVAEKTAFAADPGYRQICIDYDRCREWPADDPRLVELADRLVAWHRAHLAGHDPEPGAPDVDVDPSVLAMIEATTSGSSAAWRQLATLTRERLAPPP